MLRPLGSKRVTYMRKSNKNTTGSSFCWEEFLNLSLIHELSIQSADCLRFVLLHSQISFSCLMSSLFFCMNPLAFLCLSSVCNCFIDILEKSGSDELLGCDGCNSTELRLIADYLGFCTFLSCLFDFLIPVGVFFSHRSVPPSLNLPPITLKPTNHVNWKALVADRRTCLFGVLYNK